MNELTFPASDHADDSAGTLPLTIQDLENVQGGVVRIWSTLVIPQFYYGHYLSQALTF